MHKEHFALWTNTKSNHTGAEFTIRCQFLSGATWGEINIYGPTGKHARIELFAVAIVKLRDLNHGSWQLGLRKSCSWQRQISSSCGDLELLPYVKE